MPTALFWFRHDLRLADNPGLTAAAKYGDVVALYIVDDSLPWPMGGASRWWLHHSLSKLAADLKKHGVPLILQKGKAETLVPELAKQLKAEHVFWNRCYEPASIARDTSIKKTLQQNGHSVESFNASLLVEPWTIKNTQGNPFRVYTPFAKMVLRDTISAPTKAPTGMKGVAGAEKLGLGLNDLELLPTRPNWAKGFEWKIGEAAAMAKLSDFLDDTVRDYAHMRDRPDIDGTSSLSPYLRFGEISPRQIFHAAMQLHKRAPEMTIGTDKFVSEILWREFCYHLLFHSPKLPEEPLNPAFAHFPWQPDAKLLTAWQKGLTGIPIIDAGMRQLWQTGWMHNRVRMLVASFLIKNLLQPWQAGEAWFWDCLLDADLANNSGGWQWVAGSGADASPYYRIFNPVLQGEKFDAEGNYVRRYVPELARLPADIIHAPWKAGSETLRRFGVELGANYPKPIVDPGKSRERALAAYQHMKNEAH